MMQNIAIPAPEWIAALLTTVDRRYEESGNLCVRRTARTYTSDIYYIEIYPHTANVDIIARLFLKVARNDVDPEIKECCRNEVLFYQQVAPLCASLHLRCLSAAHNTPDGRSYILLEDVSNTYAALDWPIAPCRSEVDAVIEFLSVFHSEWWNSPKLNDFETVYLCHGGRSDQKITETVAIAGYFIDFVKDRIALSASRRLARALKLLPRILHFLENASPRTLLFGDAHFGNFLYSTGGSPLLAMPCDWQHWAIGPPAFDLASLIGLGWEPGQRKDCERDLLEKYHKSLGTTCTTSYSMEELWRDYCRCIIRHVLVCPSSQWAMQIPASSWWITFERGLGTWIDLNCDERVD